jgi:hypothetical protein
MIKGLVPPPAEQGELEAQDSERLERTRKFYQLLIREYTKSRDLCDSILNRRFMDHYCDELRGGFHDNQ